MRHSGGDGEGMRRRGVEKEGSEGKGGGSLRGIEAGRGGGKGGVNEKRE